MRIDVFSTKEGPITLCVPDEMSAEETADVLLFLEICARGMRRQAQSNERKRREEELRASELCGLS